MISIVISVVIFSIFVFTHRALYHTQVIVRKKFLATVVLFSIGFCINAWVQINGSLSFPLTNMVVYVVASLVYMLLFLSVFLADLSPSFHLIGLLRKNQHLTAIELERHFNNQTLIIKRIEQLKNDKYIREENHRYTMLPRGVRLYHLLEIYRSLLSWPEGG